MLQPIDLSAVTTVANLSPGETFSRSRLILASEIDAGKVNEAKAVIRGYLSPVIARAKKINDQPYSMFTTVGFTGDFHMVVTGIVVAGDINEDDVDDIDI